MWLIRLLIIFLSWAALVPTPHNAIDYFRLMGIYTLVMTYDYATLVPRVNRDGGGKVRSVFIWVFLLYSIIFLAIPALALYDGAGTMSTDFSQIVLFPDTKMMIALNRLLIVKLMAMYAAVVIVERVIDFKPKPVSDSNREGLEM